MEVHFRVDSSSSIGLGHMSRCLNLADGLASNGHSCKFFCRHLAGDSARWAAKRGFDSYYIDSRDFLLAEVVDGRVDFELYRKCVPLGLEPDWIVVDSYAIDQTWELLAQKTPSKVLVIDDFCHREHCADVFVNQNLFTVDTSHALQKKIKADHYLLGPSYALLGSEYSELRQEVAPRSGLIRNIFVYFGGVDGDDHLTRSLKCLVEVFSADVNITLVAPESGPHYQRVQEFCAQFSNIHIFRAGESLAALMVKSDLSVGACGATTWERACLGLPTLAVPISDNQLLVAKNALDAGACRLLPSCEPAFEARMIDELLKLKKTGVSSSWSQACLNSCDGQGVRRVGEVMGAFI